MVGRTFGLMPRQRMQVFAVFPAFYHLIDDYAAFVFAQLIGKPAADVSHQKSRNIHLAILVLLIVALNVLNIILNFFLKSCV